MNYYPDTQTLLPKLEEVEDPHHWDQQLALAATLSKIGVPSFIAEAGE